MRMRTWFAIAVVALLASGCSDVPTAAGARRPQLPFAALHALSTFETHEPGGMTQLTDRPFNAYNEDGWYDPSDTTYYVLATDSTAPKSPPNVGRIKFPAGWASGGFPASPFFAMDTTLGYVRLYASFWVRLSSNWQTPEYNPPITTLVDFHQHGNHALTLEVQADSSGALHTQVQLHAPTDSTLTANVNDVSLAPGQWHQWEVLLVANTGSTANGQVTWWIDGTEAGSYSDVQTADSTQSPVWGDIVWAPIWGDSRHTTTAAMHMDMDHFYASGSTSREASAEYPHEPAGYQAIAEIAFDSVMPWSPVHCSSDVGASSMGIINGCWAVDTGFVGDYGDQSIVQASDAPQSPPYVLQFKYPAGVKWDHLTPGALEGYDNPLWNDSTQDSTIYESSWIRVPGSDFEMNCIGVKFGGYIGVATAAQGGAPAQVYIVSYVKDCGTQGSPVMRTKVPIMVQQQAYLSEISPQGRELDQNVVPAEDSVFTFGVWHHLEYVMTLNSPPSSANGMLKLWLDGQLLMDYTDVQWRDAQYPSGFWGREWAPYWGGGGDSTATKTQTDYFQIDHVYASGIPMG